MQSTNFPVQVTIPFKQLVSIINDMDLEKKLILQKELAKSILQNKDDFQNKTLRPMTLKAYYKIIEQAEDDIENNRLVDVSELEKQVKDW